MIDELLLLIKTQVLAKNLYLNKFSINCFQKEDGEIVADFNRQEVYEGGDDRYGVGAYIRYTTNIEYSETKQKTSCTKKVGVSVPLRLVVYNFVTDKEFNLLRLEEKISNDLLSVDFGTHTGAETELQLVISDSDFNAESNWKREIQRPLKDGNNFYQMISINFNLKFVRTPMKDECFVDCYVFNNELKPQC